MKKFLALFVAVVLAAAVMAPTAFAANAKFVDTMEDNYPLVFQKSDKIRFENNKDLETTLYGKWDETPTGSAKETMFITYKMKGNITGFSIHSMHAAGFSDPAKDVSIFVSNDNKSWKEVPTQFPKLTYDPEIYLSEDTAYWMRTDISNKSSIPAGNTYLKIQLNPYTFKPDCPNWTVELDTVTINYVGAAATTAKTTQGKVTTKTTKKPSASGVVSAAGTENTTSAVDSQLPDESQTTDTQDETLSTDEAEATATTTATAKTVQGKKSKANLTWLWVAIGVVVAGGAAAIIIVVVRKKKKIS